MGKNAYKISVLAWLALLLFVFGCESEAEKFRIRVEPEAIFVDGKEIAKTTAVAKQNTLLIEALDIVLRSKREAEIAEFKKTNKEPDEQSFVMVQIAPNISYDMLFKIMATIGASGYSNIRFTSKIDGKSYTESVYLPERSELGGNRLPCQDFNIFELLVKSNETLSEPDENCLKLTLTINEEYFEIWAGGSSLPKIPIVNPIDSAYSELAKNLDSIRNRFIDSQDIDKIVILADDDMKISNIIQVMHVAGTTGFNKKNLSKFAKTMQLTKEDSIRGHNEFKARQKIIDSLLNLGLDTSSLAKLFIENKVLSVFGKDTSIALNFAKSMIKIRIQQKKSGFYSQRKYKETAGETTGDAYC